jgi:hypothetical protein
MDKSSTTVAIPATIEEAVGALTGIDALLTAKGWERAAIVYAFTANQQGSQTDQRKVADRLGVNEFARLGIAGLTTKDTVAYYRSCWLEGGGDPNIGAGDTVTLPTGKFPPNPDSNFGSRISPTKARETMEQWSPEAKAAAIESLIVDPDVEEKLTDELAQVRPELIDKAMDKAVALTPDVPQAPKTRTMADCHWEMEQALNHMLIDMSAAIGLAEEAIQNGWGVGDLEWAALAQTPDPTLQDSFTEFGKLVAMLQIDKARI